MLFVDYLSVDAQWSDWQPWTMCTSECKQYRKRNCELLNGDITEDKDCDKAERLQIRNCTSTKFCKEKFVNLVNTHNFKGDFYDDLTIKTPKVSSLEHNNGKNNEIFFEYLTKLSFILRFSN